MQALLGEALDRSFQQNPSQQKRLRSTADGKVEGEPPLNMHKGLPSSTGSTLEASTEVCVADKFCEMKLPPTVTDCDRLNDTGLAHPSLLFVLF